MTWISPTLSFDPPPRDPPRFAPLAAAAALEGVEVVVYMALVSTLEPLNPKTEHERAVAMGLLFHSTLGCCGSLCAFLHVAPALALSFAYPIPAHLFATLEYPVTPQTAASAIAAWWWEKIQRENLSS
jgi:hypothetical protein